MLGLLKSSTFISLAFSANTWSKQLGRGEYFSFYPKLFPGGPFFPLNSSLKMKCKYYRLFYSFKEHFWLVYLLSFWLQWFTGIMTYKSFLVIKDLLAWVRLTWKYFPAREGVPWQGRVSMSGNGLPCHGKVSIPGKGFHASIPCEVRDSLLGKNFPSIEVFLSGKFFPAREGFAYWKTLIARERFHFREVKFSLPQMSTYIRITK